MKTPIYYRAPLRSKAAICAWLQDRADHSRRSYGLFCYDVKLRDLDSSFAHLLKHGVDAGRVAKDASPRYLAALAERWNNGLSETAFEMGIQNACEAVLENDTNRMLWDGSSAIAEWEFNGRSSGWLCLKSFDGVTLAGMDRHEFETFMEPDGAAYSWLRNLYRFLIQCDHDFKRPESEVEYLAAGWFFANAVSGIKTDSELLAEQQAEQAESAERAHWEARDTVTA